MSDLTKKIIFITYYFLLIAISINNFNNKDFQVIYEFFNDKDNVQIIKKHSTEASEDFDNFYFDWVYIDGDHRYKYVLDDLFYWDSKIKRNGIIIGHDWCHDSGQKAVEEFTQKKGYELKYTSPYTLLKSKAFGADGHSEYLIQVK